MAGFYVAAASEDSIATPGNRRPNYICVSVTDSVGNGVAGLVADNFKVDGMIVGLGGTGRVDITACDPGRLPGTYGLDVVPFKTETWKAGGYIFAVAVARGTDRGQTLTTVLLD